MDAETCLFLILSLVAVIIVVFSSKLLQRIYSSKPIPASFRNCSLLVGANLPHGSVTFDTIINEFLSLKEVSCAMHKAGLEKCQLIVGIDFTASNEWQGRKTFFQKSLHAISDKLDDRYGRRGSHHQVAFYRDNPYQKVISILGQTLEPFDDDHLIPAFGFGDIVTKDKDVFSLSGDIDVPCYGFEEVLSYYNDVVRRITMSGPTNFVPIIKKALEIVNRAREYHILVIIADGQVADEHEEATRQAIINASWYPLSIIFVGVGDGPWHTMYGYDDKLEGRQFDNFQFVDYHTVTRKYWKSDLTFALHAMMEIPDQYKAIRALGLLRGS